MDVEFERELRGLKGDKKMSQLAVTSSQNLMKDMLQGEMGEDIKAVLNGERTVEINKKEQRKFKITVWIKNFFRRF